LSVTHLQRDTFYLAPLRGVTVRVFRNALAGCFAVPDIAVSPFIATVAGARVKPGLLADIDTALEQRIPLVPQVIGKNPEQLRVMLRAIRALGYTRADLNAGCPWPFVVKKSRGCGLLRDAQTLARMLDAGCTEMPGGFSVKVRLGVGTPDMLLERMELINSFPLCEVAIHARTAAQMYAGRVLLEDFERAANACRHPVVYNGDICSVHDFLYLKVRFPGLSRWMIGRALSIDPFLMESIGKGAQVERDAARLREFLDRSLACSVAEMAGGAQVLGRVKELWSYLHTGLQEGDRIWNALKICRSVDEYRRVVDDAFRRNLRFKEDLSRICIDKQAPGVSEQV
jgi:tRNA-dihydrouridine synthase B